MAIENIEMIKKYISEIHHFILDENKKPDVRFQNKAISHEVVFQHLMRKYLKNTNTDTRGNYIDDVLFISALNSSLRDKTTWIKIKQNKELCGFLIAYFHYYSDCYNHNEYPHIFSFFHEDVLAYRNKTIADLNLDYRPIESNYNSNSSSHSSSSFFLLDSNLSIKHAEAFYCENFEKLSSLIHRNINEKNICIHNDFSSFLDEASSYLNKIYHHNKLYKGFIQSEFRKKLIKGITNKISNSDLGITSLRSFCIILPKLNMSQSDFEEINIILAFLLNQIKKFNQYSEGTSAIFICHVLEFLNSLEKQNIQNSKIQQIKTQLMTLNTALFNYYLNYLSQDSKCSKITVISNVSIDDKTKTVFIKAAIQRINRAPNSPDSINLGISINDIKINNDDLSIIESLLELDINASSEIWAVVLKKLSGITLPKIWTTPEKDLKTEAQIIAKSKLLENKICGIFIDKLKSSNVSLKQAALEGLAKIPLNFKEPHYSFMINALVDNAHNTNDDVSKAALEILSNIRLSNDTLIDVVIILTNILKKDTQANQFFALTQLAKLKLDDLPEDTKETLIPTLEEILTKQSCSGESDSLYFTIIHSISLPKIFAANIVNRQLEIINKISAQPIISINQYNQLNNCLKILNLLQIPSELIDLKINIITKLLEFFNLIKNAQKNRFSNDALILTLRTVINLTNECNQAKQYQENNETKIKKLNTDLTSIINLAFDKNNIGIDISLAFDLAGACLDYNLRCKIINTVLLNIYTYKLSSSIDLSEELQKLKEKMTKEELMITIVKMENLAQQEKCHAGIKNQFGELTIKFRNHLLANNWALTKLHLKSKTYAINSLPSEILEHIGEFTGTKPNFNSFVLHQNEEHGTLLLNKDFLLDDIIKGAIDSLKLELENEIKVLIKEKENNDSSSLFSRTSSELFDEINSKKAKVSALEKLLTAKYYCNNLNRYEQLLNVVNDIKKNETVKEGFFEYKFGELLESLKEMLEDELKKEPSMPAIYGKIFNGSNNNSGNSSSSANNNNSSFGYKS